MTNNYLYILYLIPQHYFVFVSALDEIADEDLNNFKSFIELEMDAGIAKYKKQIEDKIDYIIDLLGESILMIENLTLVSYNILSDLRYSARHLLKTYSLQLEDYVYHASKKPRLLVQ